MRYLRLLLLAFLAISTASACTNRGLNGFVPATHSNGSSPLDTAGGNPGMVGVGPMDTAGGNPGMPADDQSNPTPAPDPTP